MADPSSNWVNKENELVFHSVTPTSLLLNLDQFLSHVALAKNGRNLNEIAASEEKAIQTALFLLKNLPPARSAALAYLAHGLSRQVLQFMQSNDPQENKSNSLEDNIETLLEELIETSPDTWAPLVAHWAVEQLGKWSVEWENILITQNDATLEEKVATWLSCSPVNSLSNVTVACVAVDPDNTVAALLESSVNIGHPLDWLVAHVGCSFPRTIVTRVLSLGLDSFAGSNKSEAAKQLLSVNKILNHLGERHFHEIRKGLNAIFMRTFYLNPNICDKAAVPFLLRLASSSASTYILNALTANIPSIIVRAQKSPTLDLVVSWWIPKYFANVSHLKDTLVNLLVEVSGGESWSLIGYLVKSSVVEGNEINAQILDQLLSQLRELIYFRDKKCNIPLFNALSIHIKDDLYDCDVSPDKNTVIPLVKWVISSESVVPLQKFSRLISCMIAQQGPDVAISLLKLLIYSQISVNSNFLHLADVAVVALLRHQTLYRCQFKALSSTISNSLNSINHFRSGEADIIDTVNKWKELIRCVAKGNLSHNAISSSLQLNICKLTKLINVPGIGEQSFDLITHLPLHKPMSLSHLLMLSQSVVYYFYSSLQVHNPQEKIKAATFCNKVFLHISQSPLGHSLLLRLLFESAFRPEWSYLLGSRNNTHLEFKEVDDNLLMTNLQYGSWLKLPLSHNSIFHAGKIARGRPTASRVRREITSNEIALNTHLFSNALANCYRAQGSIPGSTTIALLLVEYISPDIMFNGFPWPDENIKFTFERDLVIKKVFDDFPVAWHMLEHVARNKPALCYCSVLVRALTAAYTTFWNTFVSNVDPRSNRTIIHTRRLLKIMVSGQFLPDCFTVVPSLVETLAPHEIVRVLQDVWTYLRNNTPSPDRWVPLSNGIYNRPAELTDPRYIDGTRKIMLIHIESLGHHLPLLMNSVGLVD